MGFKFGSSIPIALQTFNGATNLFPIAKLFGPDDSLLQTVSLTHVSGGYYAPSTEPTMPNLEYILAQYFCYTDAGHTTLDSLQSRVIERFDLELDLSPSHRVGIELEAEISATCLTAELNTEEIEGTIEKVEFSC